VESSVYSAEKYQVNRGVIQSLLNTVAMFTSSVVRFCQVNANELLKYIMTIMNIIENSKYILSISYFRNYPNFGYLLRYEVHSVKYYFTVAHYS